MNVKRPDTWDSESRRAAAARYRAARGLPPKPSTSADECPHGGTCITAAICAALIKKDAKP